MTRKNKQVLNNLAAEQKRAEVNVSARQIPVSHKVDVVVVGGGTGAVSAAVAAAETGAKVFLVAPQPYLGDDMTATLRLWREEGEKLDSPLAKRIFYDIERTHMEEDRDSMPRPMHVKKVLDEALLVAGVEFLLCCYAADVLRDSRGNPCGIIMADRAGRQAVVAKTIIDATDRAYVARRAGAEFRPFPTGLQTFKRVVIGGNPRFGESMTVREVLPSFRGPSSDPSDDAGGDYKVFEYTVRLPMKDGSWASWAAVDQKVRTMTYHPEQQFTSDILFTVPVDTVVAQQSAAGQWNGVAELPLEAFCPKNVPHLYILGGCGDLTRQQAEKLLRAAALIELGRRIGKAAADHARTLNEPRDVKLAGRPTVSPAVGGDVVECLLGIRPVQQLPTVPQEPRTLPVLGYYDVVVIGGGTAGAAAGIGAARQGAKTLVVEYLHLLGGVGTAGAITKYCAGNRVGFTAEVPGGASWDIERKAEWWRKTLQEAGGEIWFGTLGCGAFVEGNLIRGAVVATPQGRGVVLAKVVIDATGNADIAAAAGVPCRYTDEGEFAVQGAGLPPRPLGANYVNTDYAFTDETDLVDVWHLNVYAKMKHSGAFDLGQLVDTRERRQIVGEFTVSLLDQMLGRIYPDTILEAVSGYDKHTWTITPYSLLKHPMRNSFRTYLPYRCLLPKGLRGMLVSGIGISTHCDAQPLIRMQPDVQNQGYAAGVAAAMAAKTGAELRSIDIRLLQRHLVEVGNLTEAVLSHGDTAPATDEQLDAAVDSVRDESEGLALIFINPKRTLPLLQKSYQLAQGRNKLAYAKILGMLGDATGLDTLMAAVDETTEWSEIPHYRIGRDYEGYRDVGWEMTDLDNTLIALGRTRRIEAVPIILRKLQMLKPSDPFMAPGSKGDMSPHFRSVALALELIGDPRAAKPLADLLGQPGMAGYVHAPLPSISGEDRPASVWSRWGDASEFGTKTWLALRELMYARALYRCGDYQGLGRGILTRYTKDLRGHFARHAKAVLGSVVNAGHSCVD